MKKPENYPYHFYAVVKPAKRNQWQGNLLGFNNEIVFTGEAKKNKKDVVDLFSDWFPGVIIKNKRK
jgi:hypothetical protein